MSKLLNTRIRRYTWLYFPVWLESLTIKKFTCISYVFTQIDLVIYRNHLQAAGPLTRGTISLMRCEETQHPKMTMRLSKL